MHRLSMVFVFRLYGNPPRCVTVQNTLRDLYASSQPRSDLPASLLPPSERHSPSCDWGIPGPSSLHSRLPRFQMASTRIRPAGYRVSSLHVFADQGGPMSPFPASSFPLMRVLPRGVSPGYGVSSAKSHASSGSQLPVEGIRLPAHISTRGLHIGARGPDSMQLPGNHAIPRWNRHGLLSNYGTRKWLPRDAGSTGRVRDNAGLWIIETDWGSLD
jgi:hypothetical protein